MAQLTQFPRLSRTETRFPSWISNTLWGLMLLFSAAVAVYGTTYFIRIPGNNHFAHYIFPLRMHIAGGIGALLAGPWQFSQRLRARALNFHRWMGRAAR
jgi:hypothetical protein